MLQRRVQRRNITQAQIRKVQTMAVAHLISGRCPPHMAPRLQNPVSRTPAVYRTDPTPALSMTWGINPAVEALDQPIILVVPQRQPGINIQRIKPLVSPLLDALDGITEPQVRMDSQQQGSGIGQGLIGIEHRCGR